MASFGAIGDRHKTRVAKALFELNLTLPNAPQIFIGDGRNDLRALRESPWSIGLNGDLAVQAGKIGVITPDISTLIEVIKAIQRHPEPTSENITLVISEAQTAINALGKVATVFIGGENVPPELIKKAAGMKNILRGELGALVP